MDRYQKKTGEQLTYERLAQMSGLKKTTLESIGSRKEYNPTLEKIDAICQSLGCTPCELLEYSEDS